MTGDLGPEWPVIHTYTRAQALTDGVLVAVAQETAGEAGFRAPVALSAAVHADCVAWSEQDNRRKGGLGQDEAGRLWDVLWLAALAARRHPGRDRVEFQLYRVPRGGRGRVARGGDPGSGARLGGRRRGRVHGHAGRRGLDRCPRPRGHADACRRHGRAVAGDPTSPPGGGRGRSRATVSHLDRLRRSQCRGWCSPAGDRPAAILTEKKQWRRR